MRKMVSAAIAATLAAGGVLVGQSPAFADFLFPQFQLSTGAAPNLVQCIEAPAVAGDPLLQETCNLVVVGAKQKWQTAPTGVGQAVLLKNVAFPGKCAEAASGYIRLMTCDTANVSQQWARDNSFQTIYNNYSPVRCWSNAASLVTYAEQCNSVDAKRAYLPIVAV